MSLNVGESVVFSVQRRQVELRDGKSRWCPQSGRMSHRYDYVYFDTAALDALLTEGTANIRCTIDSVSEAPPFEPASGAAPAGGFQKTHYVVSNLKATTDAAYDDF
jgi:hypothetical protein